MPRKEPSNSGAFRTGADPRRHKLTREECQRGGRVAYVLIATTRPELVKWIQKKCKTQATTRAKARYRRRRLLHKAGKLESSGY